MQRQNKDEPISASYLSIRIHARFLLLRLKFEKNHRKICNGGFFLAVQKNHRLRVLASKMTIIAVTPRRDGTSQKRNQYATIHLERENLYRQSCRCELESSLQEHR
jgi:hypothetical protein